VTGYIPDGPQLAGGPSGMPVVSRAVGPDSRDYVCVVSRDECARLLTLWLAWYRFGTDCYVRCVQIVHAGDDGDAQGRICTTIRSAGGRKVVGSNPTAPTPRKPALKRAVGRLGVCEKLNPRPWYQRWYHAKLGAPRWSTGLLRRDL
jgi:hypothetical protein